MQLLLSSEMTWRSALRCWTIWLSRKFFGVPMARRGIQPVWVHVVNRSDRPYRLQFVALDPNYFSPLEAAALNHYSGGKRLLGFGLLAWLFLPLLILLPIKLFAVRRANRRMDAFFLEHAFRMRPIPPGGEQAGFVFTNLSEGNKVVLVRLLGPERFEGLRVLAARRRAPHRLPAARVRCPSRGRRCDARWTSPDFVSTWLRRRRPPPTAMGGGRAIRSIWSSSAISPQCSGRSEPAGTRPRSSAWRRAGRRFGPSSRGPNIATPPSARLFLFGRSQDFALQRIRSSINERLHLRLWATPLQFQGQRVWIGQVSRDIGVRLTWRTWNLTTHRIDPDVDEARDYVVEDLMHVGRLEMAGYVDGVGPCDRAAAATELDRRSVLHRWQAGRRVPVGIADHAQVHRALLKGSRAPNHSDG